GFSDRAENINEFPAAGGITIGDIGNIKNEALCPGVETFPHLLSEEHGRLENEPAGQGDDRNAVFDFGRDAHVVNVFPARRIVKHSAVGAVYDRTFSLWLRRHARSQTAPTVRQAGQDRISRTAIVPSVTTLSPVA